MDARLEIVTPAVDIMLASIADLRAAAGLSRSDASRDEELTALGKRISAEIVDACGIAVGKGAEPTLRKERVRETFRCSGNEVLVLARRHNVEIVTVTENGAEVTLDARSVDVEAGLVERWVDGRWTCWQARETVVTYDAGFDTVPPSLSGVVTDLARIRLSGASADPLVKAITVDVDGVDSVRTERWVGGLAASDGTGFPAGFSARLERFMNRAIG